MSVMDDVEYFYVNGMHSRQTGVRMSRAYHERQSLQRFWNQMQITLIRKLLRRTRYVNPPKR